jgi:hypothetical protein
MGTKKGQVRKTARRAYTPKRPRVIRRFGASLWNQKAIELTDSKTGIRHTFVPDWKNIFYWKK